VVIGTTAFACAVIYIAHRVQVEHASAGQTHDCGMASPAHSGERPAIDLKVTS
jgi:hypothetical protein